MITHQNLPAWLIGTGAALILIGVLNVVSGTAVEWITLPLGVIMTSFGILFRQRMPDSLDKPRRGRGRRK